MVQLLTEKEVAKMLATSGGTLRYWHTVGKSPDYIRLEGRIKDDSSHETKGTELVLYCARR